MLVQLWGSWLVLWLLARLRGLALMVGSFLALAWLPGRREQRLFGLFANGGRGFYLLLLGVMTLALLGVALLANWWFAVIRFTPRWLAVVGAVGICLITWGSQLRPARRALRQRFSESDPDA
ncbi:hypothetical protein [Lacticaseibacillus nasuensis]|uniref:hypothetical protein n=1 Tax=Lacticaseibacillus nasuensis TaxID=944671 RepID=UPI0022465D2D|nr:hypothetical protein [Lacticaseibacillus nasuensis]MCX2455538.1 hypothetical protein [Lacticaseibacillus nasuensis]